MRLSRDLLIVLALFVVLALFTVVPAMRRAEIEEAQQTFTPYSTHSAEPDGTLALMLWLEQIGYRTQRIENDTFATPDEARVLFVFPSRETYADFEAQALLRWVERGNTLIAFARALPGDDNLLRALNAAVEPIGYADIVPLEQPLAATADVRVNTFSGLRLNRNDFVQYLSANGSPLLVGFAQGRGKIFLSTSPFV